MTRRRRLTAAAVVVAFVGLSGAPSASSSSPGWVPVLATQQQSRQVLSALPDGTGYVLDVGGSEITLWHGTRYGMVWDPVTFLPPSPDGFLRIRFATPSLGYAADLDRLYRTADGANKWSVLPGPPVPRGWQLDAYEVDTASAGKVVSLGGTLYRPLHVGCNEPAGEAIFTSPDGGHSWRRGDLPARTMVQRIAVLDDQTSVVLAYTMRPDPAQTFGPCTLLGDRNSVYVTHDGGRHFRLAATCGHPGVELCTAARFADPRTLLVGRNNGTTFASRDGGRTFSAGPALLNPASVQGTGYDNAFWVQGFAFAGGVGYATTKLSGTWRTDNNGRNWTREASCDSGFSLGIGDVAAYDREHAIAGGPTCVAARLAAAPAGHERAPGPFTNALPWTATAHGVHTAVDARAQLVTNTVAKIIRTLVPDSPACRPTKTLMISAMRARSLSRGCAGTLSKGPEDI